MPSLTNVSRKFDPEGGGQDKTGKKENQSHQGEGGYLTIEKHNYTRDRRTDGQMERCSSCDSCVLLASGYHTMLIQRFKILIYR